MRTSGWNTSEIYIAAHSLGTVFAQAYVQSNPTKFAGQILMGGGLLRGHRSNNDETGLTVFNYDTPTLTICGSKDGLYRVFRCAEGYFHQFLNIEPSQAGKYPIHLLKGGDHGSFMDDTMPLPSLVQSKDLKPTLS
jgi:hypothetical protein